MSPFLPCIQVPERFNSYVVTKYVSANQRLNSQSLTGGQSAPWHNVINLSYRPARLHRLAGGHVNPMTESNIPQSGTKNLATDISGRRNRLLSILAISFECLSAELADNGQIIHSQVFFTLSEILRFDLWLPFITVFSHSKYCFYYTMKTTISACQNVPIVRQNFILRKHTAYCRVIIPYIYLRVPECLSLRPNWPTPLPQASVSPFGTKRGGITRGEPIRTTGEKAWHCAY